MLPLIGGLCCPGDEACTALDALCLEPAHRAQGVPPVTRRKEVFGRKLSVAGLELAEFSAASPHWLQPCSPRCQVWLVWN